ncbi:MAG TPA: hypothetical protein VJH34_04695 [archaeon]|nr:hypothetical protein [archaeon]
MVELTFIATPVRGKPAWSTEDVNTYNVRFGIPIRELHGYGGANLPGLLLDAIDSIKEYRPGQDVIVRLEGQFPEKYRSQIETIFNLYAKAEGVNFKLQFIDNSSVCIC